MDLNLAAYYKEIASFYKSKSQISGRITERWASDNLYCPKCGRPLETYASGMPVYDFYCDHSDEKFLVIPDTRENFQLKSSKNFPHNNFPNRILGGEYEPTINSLKAGKFPSLILLHYELEHLEVEDVMLIHRLSITASHIIRRNKLSPTARRKDWVGSVIDIGSIPEIGKMPIVNHSNITPKNIIIEKWARVDELLKGNIVQRGWTADIIKIVEELPERFSLEDIYKYESRLAALHPQNKHIKDKIRQQLQILRDRKFIKFSGYGKYEKIDKFSGSNSYEFEPYVLK